MYRLASPSVGSPNIPVMQPITVEARLQNQLSNNKQDEARQKIAAYLKSIHLDSLVAFAKGVDAEKDLMAEAGVSNNMNMMCFGARSDDSCGRFMQGGVPVAAPSASRASIDRQLLLPANNPLAATQTPTSKATSCPSQC